MVSLVLLLTMKRVAFVRDGIPCAPSHNEESGICNRKAGFSCSVGLLEFLSCNGSRPSRHCQKPSSDEDCGPTRQARLNPYPSSQDHTQLEYLDALGSSETVIGRRQNAWTSSRYSTAVCGWNGLGHCYKGHATRTTDPHRDEQHHVTEPNYKSTEPSTESERCHWGHCCERKPRSCLRAARSNEQSAHETRCRRQTICNEPEARACQCISSCREHRAPTVWTGQQGC